MNLAALKPLAFAACESFVQERLETLEAALKAARESLTSEAKSTAGDKHETGRAMVHLEQEKNAKQLAEAKRLQAQIASINPTATMKTVEAGALVRTNRGLFYLAISAGKIMLDGTPCFAVSPAAPIAQAMLGLTVGQSFQINGMKQEITGLG